MLSPTRLLWQFYFFIVLSVLYLVLREGNSGIKPQVLWMAEHSTEVMLHWRQTKLYSEAIELVCGGSPKVCVLVGWKAQQSGKEEKQQHRTSLDQLFVQHKCTVMGKINGNYLLLPFSSLQGPSTLRGPPD